MDSARPSNPNQFLSLQKAAEYLAVSVDTLLKWNELNILKPTITNLGEVGYQKEQLDHFVSIQNINHRNIDNQRRNLVLNPIETPSKDPNTNDKIEINNQTNNYSQVNYNFYQNPPDRNTNKNKLNFSFLGLVVSVFSFFITITLIALLSQQNEINSLIYQNQINNQKNKTTNTDNTKYEINKKNNIGQSDKLNNEGSQISKNKITLGNLFNSPDKISSREGQKEISIISTTANSKSSNDFRKYNQIANFKTKNSDIQSEVFDTQGNIKVSKDDENKILAASIGIGSLTNQALPKQNSSSIIISLIIIASLAYLYTLRKKTNYKFSHENLDKTEIQPLSSGLAVEQKVLEINQKTDGTVVIYFQGKEYKVSKPELDSESDKFIGRLMELTKYGQKEIEYDSLIDEKLTLNTPLSRIVTRLGFVGIKRDLFFPRTSKTRVLFRKYLTQDDLEATSLSLDQLTSDSSINY